MRYYLVPILLTAFCSPLCAQWTEPVPMEPQFGTGQRSPWISNDGLRLYLCTIDAIKVTQRDSVGAPWGPLVRLPNHINLTTTQQSACESPSGDTLYFMSDEPPEGSYGWYDIYYSVRTDTGWGPVVNCGPNINGPGREWAVGISRDGSTLLVSSGGPQGMYLDLYYSQKQPDGTWGPIQSFGDSINSWEDEEYLSLSPDNNRLFFYRVGANMGDIWESRKVNGVWRAATPLPAPVNGRFTREMNPCMDPDGRTLWFRKETSVPYDFQIVTSVDTSVAALSERPVRPQGPLSLTVRPVGTGRLQLLVSGWYEPVTRTVVVYNLLGQEVSRGPVSFEPAPEGIRGSFGSAFLPSGTYVLTIQLPGPELRAKFSYVR